jgi:hypothetical protein
MALRLIVTDEPFSVCQLALTLLHGMIPLQMHIVATKDPFRIASAILTPEMQRKLGEAFQ